MQHLIRGQCVCLSLIDGAASDQLPSAQQTVREPPQRRERPNSGSKASLLCALVSGIALLSAAPGVALSACAFAAGRAPPASTFAGRCVAASCPAWHLRGSVRWWSLGTVENWTPTLGQSGHCSVFPKAWPSSGWTELQNKKEEFKNTSWEAFPENCLNLKLVLRVDWTGDL